MSTVTTRTTNLEPTGAAALTAALGTTLQVWRCGADGRPELTGNHPLAEQVACRLADISGSSDDVTVEPLEPQRLLLTLSWTEDGGRYLAAADVPQAAADPVAGWTPGALRRTAGLALEADRAERQMRQAERDSRALSENLASTYEEISLLHALTRRLQLSNSHRELSRLALDWLLDCISSECVFLHFEPDEELVGEINSEQFSSMHLAAGACCLSPAEQREFVALLDESSDRPNQPLRGAGSVSGQLFPAVRQFLAVPLCERDSRLGWLVAVNNLDDDSFSSVAASLMRSVSTILSIHFANRAHYEQQANLVADVVRALASAIDAKDPYTRGHSERVAGISTVLARELGADEESLRTAYIGGLLHDIGKIGVDDQVLRKDGRLTDEEFEQIKQHPRLGYNILQDLGPLKDVLPIVLHHHERWDGGGYPDRVAGEDIHLLARVAAVADAFDAMTSDRPYRRGMPLEKVEAILRDGAGSQWDAAVVDAYLESRDEIHKLIWKRDE